MGDSIYSIFVFISYPINDLTSKVSSWFKFLNLNNSAVDLRPQPQPQEKPEDAEGGGCIC